MLDKVIKQVLKNAMVEIFEDSSDYIIENYIEEDNEVIEEDSFEITNYAEDNDIYHNITKGKFKSKNRDKVSSKLFDFYGEEEY